MTNRERLECLLAGRKPDRPMTFDLLRNDAVISHCAGRKLTLENAEEVCFRAARGALDATRPQIRLPSAERVETLPDGRKCVYQRWTAWTEHLDFADADGFAAYLRREVLDNPSFGRDDQAVDGFVERQAAWARQLGDTQLFWSATTHVGLMWLHGLAGFEQFAYLLCDRPGIVSEVCERLTESGVDFIDRLGPRLARLAPEDRPLGVFLGEDIAFKTATLYSPAFLRAEFIPRLARLVEAWHRLGVKVMFHSDGNLMAILDDLAAAGIDLLNPIEILAGMDIREIHRRHPHLILAGGIDVSQLLPLGTESMVRDAVTRAIEDAEGRIMIGSSTELNDGVPLANALAMYDTARAYPL